MISLPFILLSNQGALLLVHEKQYALEGHIMSIQLGRNKVRDMYEIMEESDGCENVHKPPASHTTRSEVHHINDGEPDKASKAESAIYSPSVANVAPPQLGANIMLTSENQLVPVSSDHTAPLPGTIITEQPANAYVTGRNFGTDKPPPPKLKNPAVAMTAPPIQPIRDYSKDLHVACENGDYSLAKKILNTEDVDINKTYGVDGSTALHQASRRPGRVQIVQVRILKVLFPLG